MECVVDIIAVALCRPADAGDAPAETILTIRANHSTRGRATDAEHDVTYLREFRWRGCPLRRYWSPISELGGTVDQGYTNTLIVVGVPWGRLAHDDLGNITQS